MSKFSTSFEKRGPRIELLVADMERKPSKTREPARTTQNRDRRASDRQVDFLGIVLLLIFVALFFGIAIEHTQSAWSGLSGISASRAPLPGVRSQENR